MKITFATFFCQKLHTLWCDTWMRRKWKRKNWYLSQKISSPVYAKTHTTAFWKWRGRDYPDKTFRNNAIYKCQRNSRMWNSNMWTFSTSIKMHSALTNITWARPRTSRTKFPSNHRTQSIRINSRSLKHTTNLSNNLWMNGWNWELSSGHSITHPFTAFQRNKAKESASFKTSEN